MTRKGAAILLIPAVLVLTMSLVSCASQGGRPAGMIGRQLAPCPDTPNCVSSDGASGTSRVEPFVFSDAPEVAWARLERAVQDAGGTIEEVDGDYMWATFRSRIFRFVDDMEFRLDAANQLIHVRSASRVGHSDMGANRRRVEALRRRFIRPSL